MRAMDDPGAALVAAARHGDTRAAAAALDAGANPRLVPALVEAAARGPRELVELLIRRGAPEWLPDEAGRTPLMAARAAGQEEIAALLDRPVIRDPAFKAAVDALQRGDARELAGRLDDDPELLHVRAPEPDCYGDDYFRDPKLLWFAAFNPIPGAPAPANLVEVTRVMLDRGPEQRDLDYTLELVMTGCAARERGLQVPLMDALLAAGAAATTAAVHGALRERELGAVEALLARGHPLTAPIAAALGRTADLATLLTPENAQDALRFATLNRRADAARLALDAGADPDGFDDQVTALHEAAINDDVATVELLLDRGARTDLRDRMWDGTPLGWARHGRAERAAALLSRRAPTPGPGGS
jgi:peptide-methionine (S)-S-oxide reductase